MIRIGDKVTLTSDTLFNASYYVSFKYEDGTQREGNASTRVKMKQGDKVHITGKLVNGDKAPCFNCHQVHEYWYGGVTLMDDKVFQAALEECQVKVQP